MIYVTIILSVFLLWLFLLMGAMRGHHDSVDLIQSLVLTLSHYTLLYAAMVLLLLGIGRYSRAHALLTLLVLIGAAGCVRYARLTRDVGSAREVARELGRLARDGVRWQSVIPLAICLLVLPLPLENAELYCMGQDQGVYQAEAISYATSHYSTQHDFEEYALAEKMGRELPGVLRAEIESLTSEGGAAETLTSLERLLDKANQSEGAEQVADAIRNSYKRMVWKVIGGFYHYTTEDSGYALMTAEMNTSDVSGYYHGIHVFSAMLGLWARLFGIPQMMGLQTYLYLLIVMVSYYGFREAAARIGERSRAFAIVLTLLCALSPLLLWESKTAYSEVPMTLAMVLYLYYLLRAAAGIDGLGADAKEEELREANRALLGMTLSAVYFAVLHITFLIYYPAFVFTYLPLMVAKKRKGIVSFKPELLSLAAVGGSLFLCSVISARVSTQYYYDNLRRLHVIPQINNETMLYWVAGGILLSILMVYAFARILKATDWDARLQNSRWGLAPIVLAKLLMLFSVGVSVAYAIKLGHTSAEDLTSTGNRLKQQMVYAGHGADAFLYLSLTALALFTGLLFIAALAVFLCTPSKRLAHRLSRSCAFPCVTALFVYLAGIYTGVLNKEVFYYFYYARYFVYLVPLVIVFWEVMAPAWDSDASPRKKRAWSAVWALIPVVSILICLPLDKTVYEIQDDTQIPFEVLFDVVEPLDSDSAVILVTDRIQREFALNIKNISGADVYPLFDKMAEVEPSLDEGTILAVQERMLKKHYKHVYILIDSEDKRITENYAGVDDYVFMKDSYRHSNLRLEWHLTGEGPFYPQPKHLETKRTTSLYMFKK